MSNVPEETDRDNDSEFEDLLSINELNNEKSIIEDQSKIKEFNVEKSLIESVQLCNHMTGGNQSDYVSDSCLSDETDYIQPITIDLSNSNLFVSQKMREVARLLTTLQKADETVKCLSDVVSQPTMFHKGVEATKIFCHMEFHH